MTDIADLAGLYQPLSADHWVVGHLGQSLDGQIATANGASCYVTGPENLDHLHRMRALADAIVIGAGTVLADNPRLTVRRVSGQNPVRVVLDTEGRLGGDHGVFSDGVAPTLVASCAEKPSPGRAERIVIPRGDGQAMDLEALLTVLEKRGLRRLFIEGGGITVSRFLQAKLLDRLHICIAPVIIGQGRRGLHLPPLTDLKNALRPECRFYAMGQDVLFDLALRPTTG